MLKRRKEASLTKKIQVENICESRGNQDYRESKLHEKSTVSIWQCFTGKDTRKSVPANFCHLLSPYIWKEVKCRNQGIKFEQNNHYGIRSDSTHKIPLQIMIEIRNSRLSGR